jgi:diguanylate cyclase
MCTDGIDEAIVFAMIQLAQKLGIRVVAEGVEDEQTWSALTKLGCELIQGYLVSRPVPPSELGRQLDAQRETQMRRDRVGAEADPFIEIEASAEERKP